LAVDIFAQRTASCMDGGSKANVTAECWVDMSGTVNNVTAECRVDISGTVNNVVLDICSIEGWV
jgi:hypothetical protein